MSIYGFDHETTSAEDISKGAWRYAAHSSTRILMTSVIKGDEDPVLWNFLEPDSEESKHAKHLLAEAVESESEIFAFNAGFELAVNHYRLTQDVGITSPTIEQLRCSQAMARRAAIPVSLAKAAEFLKLPVDKDSRGKALIHVFSDQTKLVTLTHGKEKRKSANPILESPIPWGWTLTVAGETVTVKEAWEMFCAYCKKDTIVERELRKRLARFALEGDELAGYQFTNRMNQSGAPVNLRAAENAQVILDTHRENLEAEFVKITGLMPSQTAKVLAWLQHHGYAADNLQAATMEQQRGSSFLTPEGSRALEIRSDLSFAAVKKVRSLLDTVCPDETIKGSFTWYGASATGRWTSNGFQLQNARKSTIGDTSIAYRHLCEGIHPDLFEIGFGNPYEAVASCIRNFVQPHNGATMLSVDYANIESRVAALIAGQADLLDMYRQGRDAYKELASKVFGVRVEDVTKDQRFVGKVGNLSLVYQTGAKTFHETCAAWGMPIEKKIACATVKTFREENAMFPKTWRAFEAAAVKAIKEPGKWIEANEFVSFASTTKAPFHRLMMRLPSGRALCYPLPQVVRTVKRHRDYETGESREWESDDITFWGQLRGTAAWGRVSTYAGSLFQSSVQASSRDIMQHGCITAQDRGYRIFSIIHDEVLSHNDHADGLAGLEAALCCHPAWLAEDFPLEVSGSVCDHYTKD
jgi:DNA polymerase